MILLVFAVGLVAGTLASAILWWLTDPDGNPYTTSRILVVVVVVLLGSLALFGYKGWQYNRDARSLILDTCR